MTYEEVLKILDNWHWSEYSFNSPLRGRVRFNMSDEDLRLMRAICVGTHSGNGPYGTPYEEFNRAYLTRCHEILEADIKLYTTLCSQLVSEPVYQKIEVPVPPKLQMLAGILSEEDRLVAAELLRYASRGHNGYRKEQLNRIGNVLQGK